MKAEAVPKAMPPKSVPQKTRSKLKDELNHLETMGIICRDDKPSEWVSPTVIVRKPKGKVWLFLDPRHLNSQLICTQCATNTTTKVDSLGCVLV